MRRRWILLTPMLLFVLGQSMANANDTNGTEPFSFRVVTTGLSAPWEITFGPDGALWTTERVGKTISRIDPVGGTKAPLITIAEVHQSAGQDGLLGMALHPDLLHGTGSDFVYVAYTYDADPGEALDRRTKLRRYSYDVVNGLLRSPVDLVTGLPASNDHNSGRLAIGPDRKLYYTIGDQGNNQFANVCNLIRAQELPTQTEVTARDWRKYVGKILRLELDGSIPADNPVLQGVRSHVFSYGHRNAQGIVFGPDGKLYSDEQGPKTDDELNWIRAGKNYGWPQVAGYRDDRAYVYGNWSASAPTPCSDLEFSDFAIPGSVPIQTESSWSHPDFAPPLRTFYTVENGFNFQDPACAPSYYICWPTIAPSSLDVYYKREGGIPGWASSLLLTSLKDGAVFRVKLAKDGTQAVGETVLYFKTTNRYRDIAVSPDGKTFYIATDNAGQARAPGGGVTSTLENPGAILEFKYTGPTHGAGCDH